MITRLVLLWLVFITGSVYSSSDRVAYFNNIFANKGFTAVEIKQFDNYSIYKTVAQGGVEYFIFNTKWLPVVTEGFGGPLDVYMVLDSDLKIMDIALSQHSETPMYVDKVFETNQFAKNFVGLKSRRDVERIDAITRATYTSAAIIERCGMALEFLQKSQNLSSNSKNGIWIFGVLAAGFLTAIVALFFKRKKLKQLLKFETKILSQGIENKIG